MEDAPTRESEDRPEPEPSIDHLAWCNPLLCQPDLSGVPGRWHYAIGDAIGLTLQDEVRRAGTSTPPTLRIITDQHGEDEPTYCLYSESAQASSRSGERGMDLALTRLQAERLRDELSRWLERTS
jgi:hypothetical protein